MLSPSARQVIHALLTRPPLSYESLGFIVTPFDLHVLGTPPAFILSQDQTLNYSLFNPVRLLALPSFFPFTVLGFVSEISISCGFTHFSFRIFRVALLFSFQCSVLLCFQQLLQYITTTYPCQYLFWIFLHSKIVLKQRRRRDLNPRAALATYTLSRGASSAT